MNASASTSPLSSTASGEIGCYSGVRRAAMDKPPPAPWGLPRQGSFGRRLLRLLVGPFCRTAWSCSLGSSSAASTSLSTVLRPGGTAGLVAAAPAKTRTSVMAFALSLRPFRLLRKSLAALSRTFSLASFRHPVRAGTASFASGPISLRAAAASPRTLPSLSERAVIRAGTLGAPISINEPQAAIRRPELKVVLVLQSSYQDGHSTPSPPDQISPKAEAAPSRTPASLSFFSVLTRACTAESAFGPIPPKALTTATCELCASLSSRALISAGKTTLACGPESREGLQPRRLRFGIHVLEGYHPLSDVLGITLRVLRIVDRSSSLRRSSRSEAEYRQAGNESVHPCVPVEEKVSSKVDANRTLVAGSIAKSPAFAPFNASPAISLPPQNATSTAKHPERVIVRRPEAAKKFGVGVACRR